MLIRRATTVGGLTAISRLFGFVRDMILANILGAGPLADAFVIAFRLPNHFRALLAEGAFNSAFVPTYADVLERDGDDQALAFRSSVLGWISIINLLMLGVAVGATGWLVAAFVPGLSEGSAQFELVVILTKITFPYLFCVSVVSVLSGVLNAHDRFASPSAAPILLNISMILALAVWWLFPSAGHAAAVGVLVGGVAQVSLLFVSCYKARIRFCAFPPLVTPAASEFLRRLGPAVIGAGGVQLALLADTMIASFLPPGTLSYLYYADRLYQLPLAVIGIAVGTVLLPNLSRQFSRANEEGLQSTLGKAVAACLLLGFPCAIGLGLLGDVIIEVLFVHGAFDQAAAHGAGGALMAYAVGLPAAITLRSLVSAFHARGDTKTPVKALFFSMAVNIGLKILLMGSLQHIGLAISTSVGVWIYAGILMALLLRDGHVKFQADSIQKLRLSMVGCALMVLTIIEGREMASHLFVGLTPPLLAAAILSVVGFSALLTYGMPLLAQEMISRRRRARGGKA
jgi:putative peptidoglycan lipid II flippase